MATITQLKVQARNKQRVNVYLDNNFFCGLQAETVLKHNLKTGDEIEKQKLELVQFESEKQVAFSKVLNLISKREKTSHQVNTYLKDKGYTQKTIDYVVNKLKEYGYINDEKFAQNFMNAQANTKGIRKIKQQLMLKGIDDKIIKQILANMPEQSSQIENLTNKYMNNKENNQKNRSKLYAYLLRRGFTYDQIEPYINNYKDE
jgi:regulatory protein